MPIKKQYRNNPEIKKLLADAWLNIKVDESKLANPLDWPPEYFENPHKYITWVMTQPEYFSFLCKNIFNIDLLPFQAIILKELWTRKFPMLIANRGAGKSFLLALFTLLRLLLLPGRKVVIAGAAFRQSKIIFEYMEAIWSNAPIFRDIVGAVGRNGPKHEPDMYKFYINESMAACIPIGDGSKIRGLRANDLEVDEFSSVPQEIFEVVLAGFAAVKSSPIQNVKQEAAITLAKEKGWYEEIEQTEYSQDNKIIISGTAYYEFNHFAKYWKDWHEIITSGGNESKLKQYFQRKSQESNDDFKIPQDFNWRDYSIIRIPYELIPKGFMDAAQVARSRATIHSGQYGMEFGAIFSKDSQGFFKRSLIESCTASPANISVPSWPSWCPSIFEASLRGNPKKKYVFGVDPASERDNFSIIIVELFEEHRRIMYGWTTTRGKHKEAVAQGITTEENYFSYCARKIRNLMKIFPCEQIMLDSQGGGVGIMEALHDSSNLEDGENPIWPIIDPEKEKDTDLKAGIHILELVNFSSADWTTEANDGLRKDMEDRVLLFPYFDPITLAQAVASDKITQKRYDTLEDCVMDIQELKDELSTIVMSQTTAGRNKWDTPEVKLPGGKKGRLRKDRYSALLMANMGARQMMRNPMINLETTYGGFAGVIKEMEDGPLYSGNPWFDGWAQDFYK